MESQTFRTWNPGFKKSQTHVFCCSYGLEQLKWPCVLTDWRKEKSTQFMGGMEGGKNLIF